MKSGEGKVRARVFLGFMACSRAFVVYGRSCEGSTRGGKRSWRSLRREEGANRPALEGGPPLWSAGQGVFHVKTAQRHIEILPALSRNKTCTERLAIDFTPLASACSLVCAKYCRCISDPAQDTHLETRLQSSRRTASHSRHRRPGAQPSTTARIPIKPRKHPHPSIMAVLVRQRTSPNCARQSEEQSYRIDGDAQAYTSRFEIR